MEKIRVLFIQEKKIKNKAKQLLLGDVIESQDPGTYEFDYIGIKENITAKLEQFQPQIIYISMSKKFDLFEMVRKTKERCPQSVLFTLLPDDAKDQQEMTLRLKEAGVYKCYYTTLVVMLR